MATDSQRVAYNTGTQAVGKLVVSGLGALSVIMSTRYLGVDGYGQLATAIIFLSIFATLTDSGISRITVRELAQGTRAKADIIGNVLTLRLGIAAIAAGLAAGLGLLIYHQPHEEPIRQAILLLSFTLLLGTIQNTITSGLAAKLRNDLIVVGDVLGKVVTVALIFVATTQDWGFTGLVLATLAGAVANFITDLCFGLADIRPRFRLDPAYLKMILALTLPLAAGEIVNTLYYRTDGILLSVMVGSAAVGLYGVAYKVVELTMGFALLFQGSMFPLLAAAHRDRQRLHELVEMSIRQANVFAAPIMFGVMVMATELIELFAGPEFAGAALPLAVLMVGNFFIYSSTILIAALLAIDRQNLFFHTTLISLVVNIVLNLVLIPLYGVIGAAAAVAATEAVILIVLRRHYQREIAPLRSYWRLTVPFLAAALVMALALVVLRGALPSDIPLLLKLVLLPVVGVGVYGGAVLSTGLVQLDEIKKLIRRSA